MFIVNRHLAVAKSPKMPEFRCSDKMPRKSMNPTGNSHKSCVLCRSGVFFAPLHCIVHA